MTPKYKNAERTFRTTTKKTMMTRQNFDVVVDVDVNVVVVFAGGEDEGDGQTRT